MRAAIASDVHVVELVRERKALAQLERRERAAVHDGQHDGVRTVEPRRELRGHAIERARDVARRVAGAAPCAARAAPRRRSRRHLNPRARASGARRAAPRARSLCATRPKHAGFPNRTRRARAAA